MIPVIVPVIVKRDSNVIAFAAPQQRPMPVGAWRSMEEAPKDGARIRLLLSGPRELPYDVLWHEGRWCYALYKTPLFPWHAKPRMWRFAQ